MRPTGLRSPSTLVTLVSAMSVHTSGGEPRRCERTDEMGTAGTHAKVRYRCFLPDLAGFTSPRCPDHKLLHYDYSYGEGGIRTHDTLSDIHAFQACAFNRSATSPDLLRAESVGFEPTVPLPVRLISSQVPSTTRPALQLFTCSRFSARRRSEEVLEKQPALVRQDPRRHLDPVVVPGSSRQVVERAHRSRLGVRGAEHQPGRPGSEPARPRTSRRAPASRTA